MVVVGVLGVLVVFGGLWYVSEGVRKVAGEAGTPRKDRGSNSSFMEKQMEEWHNSASNVNAHFPPHAASAAFSFGADPRVVRQPGARVGRPGARHKT